MLHCLDMDYATWTFVTVAVLMIPTQVLIGSGDTHNLLACPHLKQPRHFLVQRVVNIWPIYFVEGICEHPQCCMEEQVCYLAPHCVLDVRTRV
jgi:hypothetical protein